MIQLFSIDKSFSLNEREKHYIKIRKEMTQGSVLLATCNRVEYFSGAGDVNEAILRRLFRITSGLESTLLGEQAIQNQVKEAYTKYANKWKLSGNMHKLFQSALAVGKKVRTESGISKGAMSYANATSDLIKSLNQSLEGKNIAIIGVNKMNESILKYLQRSGALNFYFGTRTFEKAQKWSSAYGGNAFKLKYLKNILPHADIIISSTAAPHYIIKENHIQHNKRIQIYDLAVPRDVEPVVALKRNVSYYSVEDIEANVKQNKALRETAVQRAEQIIENEIKKFIARQSEAKKFIAYA
jgi:glutamyl-tRNA reductase